MFTTLSQGKFTSTGLATTLQIRSDVDWIKVINATTSAAAGAGTGVEFYWQRGMANGSALEYTKTAVTGALATSVITSGGFTLVNSTEEPLGPLNSSITAVSGAAIPVVSATDTDDLVDGDHVRLYDITGAQQLGGIDFYIDTVVANTSFRLPFMAQIVAGTTGYFRKVNYSRLFAVPTRNISKITKAASAVVTFCARHNYTVGQEVTFRVPAAFGMTEIDGKVGKITAIDTTNNTITVDIDSTSFTTFAWPLTAYGPFSPAMVVAVGEVANSTYANSLDDATRNISYIGVQLGAGVNGPAGSTSDVIYWVAGKSEIVTNS